MDPRGPYKNTYVQLDFQDAGGSSNQDFFSSGMGGRGGMGGMQSGMGGMQGGIQSGMGGMQTGMGGMQSGMPGGMQGGMPGGMGGMQSGMPGGMQGGMPGGMQSGMGGMQSRGMSSMGGMGSMGVSSAGAAGAGVGSDAGGSRPGQAHEHLHVQHMVEGALKMVSMLNFMKVELGDHKTLRSKEQWRAAGAEFLGTLLFVYLGCGSVVASGMLNPHMTPARLVAIAVGHGLAIAFLAGATGAISGGHLNPAVTLAFVIAGKETLLRAGLYVGAQLFGAIMGAAMLRWSTPGHWVGALGAHDLSNGVYPGQGFIMEFMLTFVLVFVIFGVAVDRRGPGVIAPLPIGFAVLVDHLVGVPFTGASMNPARSFGPAVVSGAWSASFWIYWFGPCFGAACASALYKEVFLEHVQVLPGGAPAAPPPPPNPFGV